PCVGRGNGSPLRHALPRRPPCRRVPALARHRSRWTVRPARRLISAALTALAEVLTKRALPVRQRSQTRRLPAFADQGTVRRTRRRPGGIRRADRLHLETALHDGARKLEAAARAGVRHVK